MPSKPFRSPYSVTWEEAIESMVATLGPPGPPVLLCSTLDERGFVGPGDCFALDESPPSGDVILHLALKLGAPAILCGTRATRSVFEPEECDYNLTRRLTTIARVGGIVLTEHVLVKGKIFRFMRQSIEGDLC